MSSNKTVFFLIGVLVTILGFSMLIPYALQILLQENNDEKGDGVLSVVI